MNRKEVDQEVNDAARDVVQCAFEIHTEYGPGLLENAYAILLEIKLRDRGRRVERERQFPLIHRGREVGLAYRADLVVDECVIIELKSVEKLANAHYKQLLTYLKVADYRLGLLINFGAPLLKHGIKRIAN